MSRITSSEVRSLMEAYQAVYAPQELTEEQVWKEVENWVNSLLEEGYDLSDYTWEEMYESYVEEAVGLVGVQKRPWDFLNIRQKILDASRRSEYPASYSKNDIPTTKSGKVIPRSMAGKPVTDVGPKATKPQPKKDHRYMGSFVPGDDRPLNQRPRPTLVNHSDLFDLVKGYLLDEGYANTNEAALAIMTNMSEDWRQSIVEAEVLSKKDGVEGTGVGANFKARAWTDAEKSRYSSVAAKKPSTPSATPKPAAVQSKPQKQRTTDIITPGFTSQDKDGYIAPTAAAKDNAYHGLYADSSTNKAAAIGDWLGLDRNDPAIKRKMKDWANDDYDRKMAIVTNDPKYDPKKISYPEFTPRKRTGREAWDRI